MTILVEQQKKFLCDDSYHIVVNHETINGAIQVCKINGYFSGTLDVAIYSYPAI